MSLSLSAVLSGELLPVWLEPRPFRSDSVSLFWRLRPGDAVISVMIYGHIMPNVLPLLLLYTAFNIAWSVLAEAGASFLGFSDPNNLTWGWNAVQPVDFGENKGGLVVVYVALPLHHSFGQCTGFHFQGL